MNVTEMIGQYDLLLTSQNDLSPDEKLSPKLVAQRLAAIERIIAAQDSVHALNMATVTGALDALGASLDGLQQVIQSNEAPKEFSVFAAQLATFSERSIPTGRAWTWLGFGN